MPVIPLQHVHTVDSTSEELKRRADHGAGEQALLATAQTGGRGRLGRTWVSPPGNLHLSVLLRPPAPLAPGHWSLLAAVAAAESVTAILPDPTALRLKWPNDLMLGEDKLGGILLDAGASPTPWLVIGFGINLATAPRDLGRPTASLPPSLDPARPETIAPLLLEHLDHWRRRYEQEGFDPIRDRWQHLARLTPGTSMVIKGPTRTEGAYAGIAPDGALLLRHPDGTVLPIRSGELQ